jgi:hypothetical protein
MLIVMRPAATARTTSSVVSTEVLVTLAHRRVLTTVVR